MEFFTIEKIGNTRERTKEGFLLCRNVPIARTGMQVYADGETPIEAGPDKLVRVDRDAEDVFSESTINSFNGKPVVMGHPDGDVTPANWNALAVGIVQNARRGTGQDSELLIADLLICNEVAIMELEDEDGIREVSCGYDAKYFQTKPGFGNQRNIIGNHVALVNQARCGAICSVGDEKRNGANKMTLYQKIVAALKGGDTKTAEKLLESAPASVRDAMSETKTGDEGTGTGNVHVHVGAPMAKEESKWNDEAIGKKFDEYDGKFTSMSDQHAKDHKAVMDSLEEIKKPKEETAAADEEAEGKKIESELQEEATGSTGDNLHKSKDSAFLEDSFQETVARAEIIAPGISIPTFDSKESPRKSFEKICNLRKKALGFGINDAATNSMIEKFRGGKTLTADSLAKLPCNETRLLFHGVATMKAEQNNSNGSRSSVRDGQPVKSKTPTLAEVNKANAEFWARK